METHLQVAQRSAGQWRSSWGTVLANGARFIRPFGLRFIKPAGKDIPGDSISRVLLWHAVRPTAFKHVVLNHQAPTPNQPTYPPTPSTSTNACTDKNKYGLHIHIHRHKHTPTVSCLCCHTSPNTLLSHNSLHLLACWAFHGGLCGMLFVDGWTNSHLSFLPWHS